MSRSFQKPSATNLQRVARWAVLGCALVVIAAGSAAARAQQQRGTPVPPAPTRYPDQYSTDPLDSSFYNGDPVREQAEEKRLRAMNDERQKSMVADADRLVKMAADLNAHVNSEQRNQLTPDEERQLAEIEKLAHSIREKMSTSVKRPPTIIPTNSVFPMGPR